MKKILALLTMLTIFSIPISAHAEGNADLSNVSDEQMMQELNKRFEEKANNSAIQQSEKQEQPVVIKEDALKKLDVATFKKTVDSMSSSRVASLIDTYAAKGELSEVEQEKLTILTDKYDAIGSSLIFKILVILAISLIALGLSLFIIWVANLF